MASLVHIVVAGVHVVALIHPPAGGDSAARHELFVAINLGVAVGFWRRTAWFSVLFALLTAQQLVSHGTAAAHMWSAEHRIDVVSLLVLAWMPILLTFLVREWWLGADDGSREVREARE